MNPSASLSLLGLALGAALALGGAPPLRAQAPPAAPGGFQAAAQLLQGYDSNIFVTVAQPQGDNTTQLQLNLGDHWSGRHWTFMVSYAPQAFAYARNSSLDYLAQSYQQDLIYGWGPHTQLNWSVNAERYPERGASPQMDSGVAAVAFASQVLALETVLTGAQTTLTLSHQSSLRSTWTFSGVGAIQAFSPDSALVNQAASQSPANPDAANPTAPPYLGGALHSQSRSGGGNVGWSYELQPGRTLQVSALDNEMWFTNPAQRLRYSNLQVSIRQQLSRNLTIQAGAGPSWTWEIGNAVAAPIGNLGGQSYAANASLMRQQGRGEYGISWQHSDQVGLVPGGVTTDLLALQYQWQWGRAWSAAVSAGRSGFAGAGGAPTAYSGQNSLFIAAQLGYRINSDFSLLVSSNFNQQAAPTGLGTTGQLRRSQVSIGIAFQPRGRY